MKEILQNRAKWILIVSPILAALAVIFSYGAIAKTKNGPTRQAATSRISLSGPSRVPIQTEKSDAAEDKAGEYLDAVFGIKNRNQEAYAKAMAAARALPPSPFLQGGKFMPQGSKGGAGWIDLIPPPINTNNADYGGSASSRVQALAVHPTNPNIVYTGSYGGLAKSSNADPMVTDVTWQYLSDSWNSQAVSTIAIDPSTFDIFVGVQDTPEGIYHSANGGASWNNIGGNVFQHSAIRDIVIDPNSEGPPSPHPIYVANGLNTSACGLWQSTDGGSTWTAVGPRSDHGVYDIAIDTSPYPSTLYIAVAADPVTSTVAGVYKSSDPDHIIWSPIYTATWTGEEVGGRLGVANGEPYLIDLSDRKLRKLPAGSENDVCAPNNPNCNWIQIPTVCTANSAHCNAGADFYPGYFAVDPGNPSVILIDDSNHNRLWRTNNGGASWDEVGSGVIHLDQRVFAFAPSNSSIVYEGNDGGIVRSANHGASWSNLNDGFPGALTYGVAISQDGTLIAGTQDCGVLFSVGAAPWNMIWGGDSAHNLIDPYDSNIAYFTNMGASTFMRYDRSHPNDPPTDIHPPQLCDGCEDCMRPGAPFPAFSLNPRMPEHLVAACQTVVRSENQGADWTTIGNGPLAVNNGNIINTVTSACEAPRDSNVIYAIVSGWEVWVTTNADAGHKAEWIQITGQNWQGNINAIAVDPSDPNTVYLATRSGILKTTDMGGSWNYIGVQGLAYSDIAIDTNNSQLVFASAHGGVYASFDGGGCWTNMSAGIPGGAYVTALSINALTNQVAAAVFGRGVYLLTLGDLQPGIPLCP